MDDKRIIKQYTNTGVIIGNHNFYCLLHIFRKKNYCLRILKKSGANIITGIDNC